MAVADTCVTCKKSGLPPALMALDDDVSLAICEPCAENLARYFFGGELALLRELEKIVLDYKDGDCDVGEDRPEYLFWRGANELLAKLDKRRAAIKELSEQPGRWRRDYVDQFTIDKVVALLEALKRPAKAHDADPDAAKGWDACVWLAVHDVRALATPPDEVALQKTFLKMPTAEEVRAWHASEDHHPIEGGGVFATPAAGLVRVHCKKCGKPFRVL